MAAVWLRFRAELRRRWQSVVVLALVGGIAGGAALAAFAGARRTDSAFPRLLRATNAWHVLVNPDLGVESKLDSRKVEHLPQVAQAARVDGLMMGRADAHSFTEFARFGITLAPRDGAVTSIGRPKMLDGRVPRADRPNEVVVNPVFARENRVAVGSVLPVVGFSFADFSKVNPSTPWRDIRRAVDRGELGTRFEVHIVGIGITPDNIVVDEGFADPSLIFSSSVRRAHPQLEPSFWGELVRLKHGAADIPAFRRAVEAMVPGEAIAFQTVTSTSAKVARAVRPDVGALIVFGVVIALSGLLVVGQALARQSFLDAVDHPVLRSIGATRRELFAGSMLRAALVGVLAGVTALIIGIAASPLMPIGPAGTAEPHPGIAFDGFVLGFGVVAMVLAILVLAAWPAWRYAGRLTDSATNVMTPSRITSALSNAGATVPLVSGVRMALEPGRGRTAVPVRTTIVSAFMAVAMVIGALVLTASVDHLVRTPRLFGWNWDVQLTVSASDLKTAQKGGAAVADVLQSSPAVGAWTPVVISDVRLRSGAVPAFGIDARHRSVLPTLVDGRLPRRENEIALGERTMRALGVERGSVVTARTDDGRKRTLQVVGRVVLPGVGTYPGADKTSLGEGAVVTRAALRVLGPKFARTDFFIAWRRSSTAAQQRATGERANAAAERIAPDSFQASRLQRPSDVLSYERVRDVPIFLAAVLAILAGATVAHALVTSVRRRRRELALLETLGFTRRQVSATVAWQSTTVALAALVVGVPLGIILGRWGWTALADDLGTVPEPIVPAVAVLLAVPVVIALVNVVAFVPGRIAARLRPAVVLRSE
ncbi:MAG: FtsX-like permease family protein [Actinobacteria bacterium]|nr:MAG: FtsX-like permease family protein [Actinomycetota bacterium]